MKSVFISAHHDKVSREMSSYVNQQWDTADAEIKIPSAEKKRISKVLSFYAWSRVQNRLPCFAHCQQNFGFCGFCLISSFGIAFFVLFLFSFSTIEQKHRESVPGSLVSTISHLCKLQCNKTRDLFIFNICMYILYKIRATASAILQQP